MLLDLRAEKYTVIESTRVEFGPGLNLLTGETGAGKSILIDALALLLGGKSSADVVRYGEERATIGCTFESTPGVQAVLSEAGIDVEEDVVLLRREMTSAGKGRVFINNQLATVGVLRQLAPELALVHAQNETTATFSEAEQRTLLDRYAALSTADTARAHQHFRDILRQLAELENASADRDRLLDLWRFQAGEIAEAHVLSTDEDQALEAEKRLLSNAERLAAASLAAYDSLYEAEISAESTLGSALRSLEDLARFDPAFTEAVEQIKAAKASVEDVAGLVRRYAESAEGSPERLAAVEDRLVLLSRLKRKYGPTLADVLALGQDLATKLDEVEHRDDHLQRLRADLAQARDLYAAAARRLSEARQAAAGRLAPEAEREINQLAMRVRFAVEVTPMAEDETTWSPGGWDEVSFRVATNAGEPLRPLDEIASGGEMSRVMLALKVAVERQAQASTGQGRSSGALLRTLIFDEIDVGIGGVAAEAVGQKLKQLSRSQQVVCITHLPQIAAFADHHFLISKTERAGRTETVVRPLDDLERRQEIARMLSGSSLTETSLRHAEHLLQSSR